MDNPADRGIFKQMVQQADIVIAGGGLNGPALGLALAQAGLRVVVVDARAAPDRATAGFDGRAYSLAIASKRLLQGVGVWPSVEDLVQPIIRIKASDGLAGRGASPFHLAFDSAELEEGPMGFMLEDRHLYAAFLAAMRGQDGLTLISGDRVVDQRVTTGPGVAVTLASGAEVRARLLVGCDGRGSGVAARAGIARVGWGYGQTALVTAVHHAGDHGGVAQQYFMPGGPLAILPLKAGIIRRSSGARRPTLPPPSRDWMTPPILPLCGPGSAIIWAKSCWRGPGSPIRSACRWRKPSSVTGWHWWAMRRMGCIRWQVRA